MPELRSVVIEIKTTQAESESGNSQKKETDPKQELANKLNTALHPLNSLQEKVLGKSVLLNQAFDLAKRTITTNVNRSFQKYFALSEDYLGENTYNIITGSINKLTGAGTSIVAGAVAGAKMGGSAGAIVGATISAIGVGINEVVQYNQKMSSYYQSLNATRYSTQYSRTRAGLVNDSRGTEN